MATKKTGYKTTKRNIEKAFSESMVKAIEQAISLSKEQWKNPCPFVQGQEQGPYNYATGKAYDGVNVLMLNLRQVINGYSDGAWLTFNQVKAIAEKTGLNIRVKKGEKASEVVFWKKWLKVVRLTEEEDTEEEEEEETEETTEEEKKDKSVFLTKWVLKSYYVFNVEQVEWDGYDYSAKLKKQTLVPRDEVVLASMDSALSFLTKKYKGGAPKVVESDTTVNYYSPSIDTVVTCHHEAFSTADEFFSTLAHELGHSTGHASRLDRKANGRFGSSSYAKEELVAETTALMCCASVGLLSTYENSIAYLKSWLKAVKENADSIVWAFKEASKATSWILGLEDKKATESEE